MGQSSSKQSSSKPNNPTPNNLPQGNAEDNEKSNDPVVFWSAIPTKYDEGYVEEVPPASEQPAILKGSPNTPRAVLPDLFPPVRARGSLVEELTAIIQQEKIISLTQTHLHDEFFKNKTLMEVCLDKRDCELFRQVLTRAHGPGSYRWQDRYELVEKRGWKVPSTPEEIATGISEIIAYQLTQTWEGHSILDHIVRTKKLNLDEKIQFLRVFHEVSPKSLRHPNHGTHDNPPRCLGSAFFDVAEHGVPEMLECLLSFKVFTREAVAAYVCGDSHKSLLQMAENKNNWAMVEYLKKFTAEVKAQQQVKPTEAMLEEVDLTSKGSPRRLSK